jgi:hypothetical protein
MFNPEISLYKGVKDTKGTIINALDALSVIKSDELSNQIYTITHELDKKKRNALKVKLPAVTWSGTFTERKADEIIKHSGIICLDFDGIQDVSKVRNTIAQQRPDFLWAMFISPSGTGLKLLCRVPDMVTDTVDELKELHLRYFNYLTAFIQRVYDLEADESGKDMSRLCFLSWDMGCLVFDDAEPVNVDDLIWGEGGEIDEVEQDVTEWVNEEIDQQLRKTRQFTDRVKTYSPGKRNDYINTFAYNAKRNGIDQADCLYYCRIEFHDYADGGVKAVENIVKSVYANGKIGFGDTKQLTKGKRKPQDKGNAGGAGKKQTETATDSRYNETIKFWYTIVKKDKETGEEKEEYRFDHDGLTYFLANNGFMKLKLGDTGYQYVRLNNGLLESVEPDDISVFVMDYLHKNVNVNVTGVYTIDDITDELHEVRKMYKRGLGNYSKPAVYTSLPALKANFIRDTEKASYQFFNNGYVEVSADEAKLFPYHEMTAHIWAKQRKNFDLKLLGSDEITESVIYKFVHCAIVGRRVSEEAANDEQFEKDKKRLLSMLTTIGYLVDTYKDPTNTKAVVFQDKKPNLSGAEANGGTGKSFTGDKMLSKLVSTCVIDGKDFSFNKPYPYDTFRADNKLIVYNDVNKRFPFESLFHKITEDFSYDKRYVDAVVIPHEDAPKHLIITNYTLMGEGSSFRRRQHIIEFTDFFSDTHSPKDEFKHRLFFDWDEAEWNRFYNFMIECVRLYKKFGLVEFPAENVKVNKLALEAGEEFIEWMDELFIGDKNQQPVRTLERNPKDELFEQLITQVRRHQKLQNSNKFTGWVKQWGDIRGFRVQVDKSGRNYYWTFVKK